VIGNKKLFNIITTNELKALVSDHSIVSDCFIRWSLTRARSRERPALVATTFLNSLGGRLRELRLYRTTVTVKTLNYYLY